MRIQINKWGNSLAFRIPKTVVKQLKLTQKTEMDMELKDNSLILSKPEYTLEELLSNVTPDMLVGEIDWGPPVGKEIW